MFQGPIIGPILRAGIHRQASRVYGSGSIRPFHAYYVYNAGSAKNSKIETRSDSSIFGNLGMKLGLVRVTDNASLPSVLSFRSFIHSGEPREAEEGRTPESTDPLQGLHGEIGNDGQPPSYQPQAEAGRSPTYMDYFREIRQGMVKDASGHPPLSRRLDFAQGLQHGTGNSVNGRPSFFSESRTPRSMDYVQGLLNEERGDVLSGRSPLYQPQGSGAGGTHSPMDHVGSVLNERALPYQVESNADIVHIKLTRNNSYVTLTDSKGNKKAGISAAMAAGKGDKPARYSAEAAAENIGHQARQMRVRSVVVKVSGLTFFKKKKDAILAFKDGYSSSRRDVNPIVYVEDTTRKPHNGCRRPKKRRI